MIKKFKKEIKITVEGEIYDEKTTVEEILKKLSLKYWHWWEIDNNWPYGTPSENVQGGAINKIIIQGKEFQRQIEKSNLYTNKQVC